MPPATASLRSNRSQVAGSGSQWEGEGTPPEARLQWLQWLLKPGLLAKEGEYFALAGVRPCIFQEVYWRNSSTHPRSVWKMSEVWKISWASFHHQLESVGRCDGQTFACSALNLFYLKGH